VAAVETRDGDLQERIRQTPKLVLGGRIKQAREEAGYTHDYLGELCGGMYRQSLISLEKGRWRPRPATLRMIAQHTKRDISWFVGPEVDPARPFQHDGSDGDA
jgi:DNA-binding XRE family transcriptional regulator